MDAEISGVIAQNVITFLRISSGSISCVPRKGFVFNSLFNPETRQINKNTANIDNIVKDTFT